MPFVCLFFSAVLLANVLSPLPVSEGVRLYSRVKPILRGIFGSDAAGEPLEADHQHDFLELCSGAGHWSQVMRALGFTGISMDILYNDRLYDILSPIGFCTLVAAIWRVRRFGFFLMAPPCSTWVFMSRGSTGRSRKGKNQWKGNKGNKKVRSQNRFMSRLSCILELCRRRKVRHILEQPSSTMMLSSHKRLLKAKARNKKVEVKSIKQGAFCANSCKETFLQTDVPMGDTASYKLQELDKCAIQQYKDDGGEVSRAYLDKHGKKKHTGGRDIKGSQTYSYGFASFMALKCKAAWDISRAGPESISSSDPSCTSSSSDSDEDMFVDIEDLNPLLQPPGIKIRPT